MNPLQPFDSTIHLLSKSLDLRAKNQQVILSNVANAETPGYTAASFQFEDALRQAIDSKEQKGLAVSHPAHFPLAPQNLQSVQGEIVHNPDQAGIGDNNTVNLDQEMLNLSENELVYETSAQLLQKKISQIRYVIAGGQ